MNLCVKNKKLNYLHVHVAIVRETEIVWCTGFVTYAMRGCFYRRVYLESTRLCYKPGSSTDRVLRLRRDL